MFQRFSFKKLEISTSAITGWVGAFIAMLTAGCTGEELATTGTAQTATPTPTPESTTKHIFVTAATHDGKFGVNAIAAVMHADAFCQADVNHPGTGTYKAMIASTYRNTSSNWVLKASQQYLRLSDDAIIGTTNTSKTFDFPLENAIDTTNSNSWTGLYNNWSSGGYGCQNWTNNQYAYGIFNDGSATTSASIYSNYNYCYYTRPIICVEQ